MARPEATNADGHPPAHPASCAFPRAARLKRRRLIRPLFDRRRDDVHTVAVGCVRLLFRVVPREETGHDVPIQIGFAPGRTQTAVQRNRLRRLLREVYRRHQHPLVGLFQHREVTLTLVVLFRGSFGEASRCIPRDLPIALQKIAAQFTP